MANYSDIEALRLELRRLRNGGEPPVKKTKVVSSKSDPSYVAYKDSLDIFNSNQSLVNNLKRKGYESRGATSDDKKWIAQQIKNYAAQADGTFKYDTPSSMIVAANPQKKGKLYEVDDLVPHIIREGLGKQLFSKDIMPKGQKVYSENLLGLGFGDKRVTFDYSNVNPKQKVIVVNKEKSPITPITPIIPKERVKGINTTLFGLQPISNESSAEIIERETRPEARIPDRYDVMRTHKGWSEHGKYTTPEETLKLKEEYDRVKNLLGDKAPTLSIKPQWDTTGVQKKLQNGGELWYDNTVPSSKPMPRKTFLQPGSDKLPSANNHSEVSISIGGENGEPAYIIPSFKGGKFLKDPIKEFKRTGENLGGPFKTWQDAERFNTERHKYVENGKQDIPTPLAHRNMQNGGESNISNTPLENNNMKKLDYPNFKIPTYALGDEVQENPWQKAFAKAANMGGNNAAAYMHSLPKRGFFGDMANIMRGIQVAGTVASGYSGAIGAFGKKDEKQEGAPAAPMAPAVNGTSREKGFYQPEDTRWDQFQLDPNANYPGVGYVGSGGVQKKFFNGGENWMEQMLNKQGTVGNADEQPDWMKRLLEQESTAPIGGAQSNWTKDFLDEGTTLKDNYGGKAIDPNRFSSQKAAQLPEKLSAGEQSAMTAITNLNDIAESKNYSNEYKWAEKEAIRQGNTDSMYGNMDYQGSNPYGDYLPNVGAGQNFRPNANTIVQDAGNNFQMPGFPRMKDGGEAFYDENEEYDLTEEEIQDLIAQGYDIEMLD